MRIGVAERAGLIGRQAEAQGAARWLACAIMQAVVGHLQQGGDARRTVEAVQEGNVPSTCAGRAGACTDGAC